MASHRPANLADLPQIRAINTHYILHTSLTFMQAPPALHSYTAKWHDLMKRGLPYLVAVDSSHKTGEGLDLVLGYAYLSPFRGHLVSYAPTVELSLFVHPDYQSRSVGSNLLGALLRMVRAGDISNYCEELQHIPNATDSNQPGTDAIQVRSIIAVMAVDPEGKDGGDALRRWYIQRGFVERGRMVEVGFKRGHWIDTIYLQYSSA
ncbi:uncharacterized protein N7459_002204 [Penicillium hispanicum]|uniref:uncharacterized protein n=1 Tax=Penicillium hispanicum TaxID=1080232 RepID=UPI00254225CE|nr:uncharacterized protein N7459_002204 [Penicillium hispanicum]KAJ5591835.1 hypothetical protein N7459_002204 [Penicillium hispanicum]